MAPPPLIIRLGFDNNDGGGGGGGGGVSHAALAATTNALTDLAAQLRAALQREQQARALLETRVARMAMAGEIGCK